jgi:outer membrane beta-barrel protein
MRTRMHIASLVAAGLLALGGLARAEEGKDGKDGKDGEAKPAPAGESKPAGDAAAPTGDEAAKDKQDVEVRQDRIKSIQRKPVLKAMRWELTPTFTFSLNDAFYQKMGGGLGLTFHPADALGLELAGTYVGTIQTDMVGFFQQANQALPKVSKLLYYITGSVAWSPLYGKLSFVTDDIVYLDMYLLAGFGMAYSETGAKLAGNVGLGLRYFINSWLVLKIEVRDLIYTETFRLDVQRTEYSDIQNHVMFDVGLSFFLPTDFDYEFQ